MSSIVRSTGIVALSTLMSRILGLIRDILFANYFGATASTDAYIVAFRIPNLMRRLVAEGALTISFIPVYSEYLINRGEKESLALAQKTLSILTLVILCLVSTGIIFSPEIVKLFAYGFKNPDSIELAVNLTRIMLPFLFFVAFVAFSMGVQNSHGYFFAPAFAPVLLNVGIIIGILFFSQFCSEPIYGVALGVITGGILQFLLQIPYLVKSGFRMKLSFDFKHPGIQKIFKMITPALFGFAVYQINILMSTILASMLPEGSISYLNYSDRLNELVLGVFIVSIGNVILPEMSKMTALNDYNKLKSLYVSSIRASLFLAIPASIALITVGFPIISVLFMRGQFTGGDAQMTYKALFYASMGMGSIAILRVTTPTFYSLKDTKTPVAAAVVSFVLNISLGYILMQTELKHAGLALANAVSATVQMLILFILLQKRIGILSLPGLLVSILKFFTASGLMCVTVLYFKGKIDWVTSDFFTRLFYLIIIVSSGGAVYLLSCYLLGVEEIKYFIKKFRK